MPILKKTAILFFTIFLSILYLGVYAFSTNADRDFPEQTPVRNMSYKNICTFYKWFDPSTSEREGKSLLKNCASCHMAYYDEWKDDKHSMSQNNPFFLSVYNQFKKEHPGKNGNCALCHNPEAALDNDFNIDLRKRNAVKSNGISCDFCHKIESLDQNPLKKGVAGLNILRTCKGMKDIRFGPIKDPIEIKRVSGGAIERIGENEELKYNSLYKTSLACAKCHDGSNGNVQIYSTFTEWANSPAAKKGVQCQTCHMKPGRDASVARLSIVDNPDIKQKSRPYYEIHSHSFLTENPHKFRKKYVDLNVETRRQRVSTTHNDILIVKVIVTNNNTGHSFPTGSPMRNVILVIEARDKNGRDLKLINGSRLLLYAGNLEHKPGKLFAKILNETSGEYAGLHGKSGIKFRNVSKKLGIPAQDWWNIFIASDTRIMAGGEDISTYEFSIPMPSSQKRESGKMPLALKSGLPVKPGMTIPDQYHVIITAKLIWRNTWPGLAKIKGVKLIEDILVEKNLIIRLASR